MSIWQWVALISAAWTAVSITLAIVWHRAAQRRPRIVRTDGRPISQREIDGVRRIAEFDHELRNHDLRGRY